MSSAGGRNSTIWTRSCAALSSGARRTRTATATDHRFHAAAPILLSAALLIWPACWNGYPLVFADTGTYLSQAIEHYLGWDRPVFYSLFLLPLHLTLTTWPVIIAQALLTVHVLHLAHRAIAPLASPWWLPPMVAPLVVATALPWFASQLMPDLFTPLLVLALILLVLAPETLSRRECTWLVLFATFMVAAHQSNVPLTIALLLGLLPLRRARLGLAAASLALAVLALVAVNLVGFGRASLSPFGNVFLLARVIYDGPGADVLRHDCPQAGWHLCSYASQLPPSADDFLWRRDGPVIRAGGAKLISTEADAIIGAAVAAEPGRELRAFLTNALQQLTQFASGDGLQAWPDTVTPVLEQHFPAAERNAYAAALQTNNQLAVPGWMQWLHADTAIAGVAACIALALSARGQRLQGFAVAALLALLVNAAITGGLSGPHDRYQSRIMWLPSFIALLGWPNRR